MRRVYFSYAQIHATVGRLVDRCEYAPPRASLPPARGPPRRPPQRPSDRARIDQKADRLQIFIYSLFSKNQLQVFSCFSCPYLFMVLRTETPRGCRHGSGPAGPRTPCPPPSSPSPAAQQGRRPRARMTRIQLGTVTRISDSDAARYGGPAAARGRGGFSSLIRVTYPSHLSESLIRVTYPSQLSRSMEAIMPLDGIRPMSPS